MKRITYKHYRGFTLIEMMMVIFILSFVIAAIYSVYLTHQRTAYTSDEVVEVQQNLRIGMDSITRDVRMAGFLVPYPTTPVISAIVNSGTGTMQPLPAPDNIRSDALTITTASASDTIARIQTPAGAVFTVDDPLSVDPFSAGTGTNGDVVTIIRPGNRFQPAGPGNTYTVTSKNRAVPSLTLSSAPGGIIIPGDLIVSLGTSTIYPNTITYCLGPSTLPAPSGCGNTVTTCPTGQLCLMRIVNIGNGANESARPIAQNMAGLQINYLLDDGSEVAIPSDLTTIRAVRVTLIGQTIKTVNLSNYIAKQRRIESIIKMRNR